MLECLLAWFWCRFYAGNHSFWVFESNSHILSRKQYFTLFFFDLRLLLSFCYLNISFCPSVSWRIKYWIYVFSSCNASKGTFLCFPFWQREKKLKVTTYFMDLVYADLGFFQLHGTCFFYKQFLYNARLLLNMHHNIRCYVTLPRFQLILLKCLI